MATPRARRPTATIETVPDGVEDRGACGRIYAQVEPHDARARLSFDGHNRRPRATSTDSARTTTSRAAGEASERANELKTGVDGRWQNHAHAPDWPAVGARPRQRDEAPFGIHIEIGVGVRVKARRPAAAGIRGPRLTRVDSGVGRRRAGRLLVHVGTARVGAGRSRATPAGAGKSGSQGKPDRTATHPPSVRQTVGRSCGARRGVSVRSQTGPPFQHCRSQIADQATWLTTSRAVKHATAARPSALAGRLDRFAPSRELEVQTPFRASTA
jgi:hypothetical protein